MNDLDWLARNVHVWLHTADYLVRVGSEGYTFREHCEGETIGAMWFTRDQWLARRAELQNKPNWGDAPEWAEWLAQHSTGCWSWGSGEAIQATHDLWYSAGAGTAELCSMGGEVLGDWRDTLERRPQVEAEITDPFDPEFRQEPSPGGLAVEVVSTLKKTPSYFSSNELMGIYSLIGYELNKRDAAVCGGQKYLDTTWFERGELPPVGTECLYAVSDRRSCEVEITAHAKLGICFVELDKMGENYVSKTDGLHRFHPMPTERERVARELVDVMMSVPARDSETTSEHHMRVALAVYDHLHK